MRRQPFSEPLDVSFSGWDVLASLLGLVAALTVHSLTIPPLSGGWSYKLVWFGAPALFIAMRRQLLPPLSPPQTAPATSGIGRAFGYLMIVGAGLVALFSSILAAVGLSVDAASLDGAVAMAGFLGAFAIASWIGMLGLRRVG